MDIQIDHNKDAQQFRTIIKGDKAYLSYKQKNDEVMDLYETFVPEEHRHQGIAAELTEETLEYAKKNDMEVIPSCPYVASYIDSHEEHQDLKVGS